MNYETISFTGTMKETKDAIYLPKPHAEWIWEKKKKFIVQAKKYSKMAGKLLYFADKEFAYGIIRLKKPILINLKQFKKFQKVHLISDKERIERWRAKEYLFLYSFDMIERFKEPKEIKSREGTQTFTKDIKFLNQVYELVKNIREYDPIEIGNLSLIDDWKITCVWYSSKKKGKKIPLSVKEIINLAKLIYDEIIKRAKAGKMRYRFEPKKMNPALRELYNKVSKEEIIHQMSDGDKFKIGEKVWYGPIIVKGDSKKRYFREAIIISLDKQIKTGSLDAPVKIRIKDTDEEIYTDPDNINKLQIFEQKEIEMVDMDLVCKKINLMKPFAPLKSTAIHNETLFHNFNKIMETLNPTLITPFIIEQKFDGFRVMLHKKRNIIKIFSDRLKDITVIFPTIVEQAKKMSRRNLILDAEIVFYDEKKQALGYEELMQFIESGKKFNDSRIKFHVFDILFYDDKAIADLKLYERKKILQTLNWTDNIINVPFITAKNDEQLAKGIKVMGALSQGGAMIKRYNSNYPLGTTPNWIEFRITQKLADSG